MNAPQRSTAWFEARKRRVTASNVGAILGLSPYATREDAMRSMVREALGAQSEFTGNAATAWGNAMESHARADYEMDTGSTTLDASFVPYLDWLGASPDAYANENTLLEIKAPFYIRNDPVPKFKTVDEQPHYHAQMQIQMLCTGRAATDFYQWTPFGQSLVSVDRDDDWLSTNLPILKAFHEEFLDELANNADEHLAPRRATIDTPDAHKMAAEYDQLVEAIENAEARKKDLLAEMVALAGDRDALFAGRKLTRVAKAGAVRYAAAMAALLPKADLEPFRGSASVYWRLS